jgi:hypothetical protein
MIRSLMTDDELVKMWVEAVVTCFKVISQNLPGGAKKNYEKRQ